MYVKELFKHWTFQLFAPGSLLRAKYNAFRALLEEDEHCLNLIADLEEIVQGQRLVDFARTRRHVDELIAGTGRMVSLLMSMNPKQYMGLSEYHRKQAFYATMAVDFPPPDTRPPFVLPLGGEQEVPHRVGGKAFHLGALMNAGFQVPPGFTITTACFNYLLEANELRQGIDAELETIDLDDPKTLIAASRAIQSAVRAFDMPAMVFEEISAALEEYFLPAEHLAVRSSAVLEDGASSFAGQYSSRIGVLPKDVFSAYLEVLASKYSPRAMTYRILAGVSDLETSMAVVVQRMVPAAFSGVMYTVHVEQDASDLLALYAVQGQGAELVDGGVTPQRVYFSKGDRPAVVKRQVRELLIPEERLLALAEMGLRIERHFQSAQDVEWAMDAEGGLFVLQSRDLSLEENVTPTVADLSTQCDTVLKGLERASQGVGYGPVVHLPNALLSGDKEPKVDPGSVLLVDGLSPDLAGVVRKTSGIIAKGGSRASHFASVAREFGLPVLILPPEKADQAERFLPPGMEVTVDGFMGKVCSGRVPLLEQKAVQRINPCPEPLRQAILRMTGLTLTDPEGENFSPQRWRSLQDVVRFTHEMAMREMFSLVGKDGRGMARAKKFVTSLPLVLYVLDVQDGLLPRARQKKEVCEEDLRCLPMWSLWFGLTDKRVAWSSEQLHVDWEQFDRISAGIFGASSKLLASYAVISRNYMHLMIRFGYHFSVVDSVCGEDVNANYIRFTFKGGGAGYDQRVLRLSFIRQILEEAGYTVRTKGDMLEATYARMPQNAVQQRLATLGYLLARTRFMDMELKDQEQVNALVRAFMVEKREDALRGAE